MEKKTEELLITLYNKIDNWNKQELEKCYSDNAIKNLKEEMTNISNTIKALLYENLLIENKEKNNVK